MMNCELNSYLETIEPELRVLTRLFGFAESVWNEPKKFVPLTAERDGQFIIRFEADGLTILPEFPAGVGRKSQDTL